MVFFFPPYMVQTFQFHLILVLFDVLLVLLFVGSICRLCILYRNCNGWNTHSFWKTHHSMFALCQRPNQKDPKDMLSIWQQNNIYKWLDSLEISLPCQAPNRIQHDPKTVCTPSLPKALNNKNFFLWLNKVNFWIFIHVKIIHWDNTPCLLKDMQCPKSHLIKRHAVSQMLPRYKDMQCPKSHLIKGHAMS